MARPWRKWWWNTTRVMFLVALALLLRGKSAVVRRGSSGRSVLIGLVRVEQESNTADQKSTLNVVRPGVNKMISLLPGMEKRSALSSPSLEVAAEATKAGRRLLLSVNSSSENITSLLSMEPDVQNNFTRSNVGSRNRSDDGCLGVHTHDGYADRCTYVRKMDGCQIGTYVDYLRIYYCHFRGFKVLGVAVLFIWLVTLFFMLGNTAADYFCPSLEELSDLLHLPPTVAGVTLLPFGNGAPDVFASIAAFVGAGQGQVGLNSVLGAATFVTCVVAGSVAIAVSSRSRPIRVDGPSFIRDVSFFIFTLIVLLTIVLAKKIHLWGALAFFSIYLLYCVAVATTACSHHMRKKASLLQPLLSKEVNMEEEWGGSDNGEGGEGDIGSKGINRGEDSVKRGTGGMLSMEVCHGDGTSKSVLPQWMWTRDVDIFHVHPLWHQHGIPSHGEGATVQDGQFLREEDEDGHLRPLWGWGSDDEEEIETAPWYTPRGLCNTFVKFPLMLPRMLTIPMRQKDPWLRPYAFLSIFLAPSFFVLTVIGTGEGYTPFVAAAVLGALFGVSALLTDHMEVQPKAMSFLWVLNGFIMSIVWFYVIANELVSLLVSFGVILHIDPAILGLTVLAWGNSVGDLMANLALACSGGRDRIQIAWSGCHAGPMFNTLMGLGISLILTSWRSFPHAFPIREDPTLPWTMMFLLLGLIYALVVLPLQGMRLTKSLGIGLICIYLAFVSLRLLNVVGFVALPAWTW